MNTSNCNANIGKDEDVSFEARPIEHLLALMIQQGTIHANRIRELHPHIESYSDLYGFLRDYATIRFDPGQRSGKTTAICRLAAKGDVIVTEPDLILPSDTEAKIVTRGTKIESLTFYRRIFVDNASWLYSNAEINDLIKEFARSDKQLFILVG